jgi:RNA polymerase sigma factor for flagellar operon FliA
MPKQKSVSSSKKASSAPKRAPKAAAKARGRKLAPAKVAVERVAALHDQHEPPAALPNAARGRAKGPAISAPHEEPAAKKVPAPFKASGDRRPTVEQLHAMPVEEIWPHYRKAAVQRPRDEEWIKKIRNVLMELHYPLVKHIAERLLQTLPKSIELDDLVSAGLFGLMDAIRGFDPDRGIKFKTYCTTRIRGSILDQLRSQDWVPRLVRLKAGRIDKALQRLQGEYGREPTHAELANALRMEHGELADEMSSAHAKTMFSLSDRWDDRDDDNSMEKVEIVEDHKAVDPIAEINRRDVMKYITKSLTHKERFIIEQYYHVGHTMREIGEMLALTESRVCQIHSNVMSRLKGLLTPSSNSLEA